jgi:hypothetical protein
MIQYSRGVDDKPMGRGVLDRPVKPGDDEFCWLVVVRYCFAI